MKIPKCIRVERFILDYLNTYSSVSACDEKFHELYFHEFGDKRNLSNWGVQVVPNAQRWLKRFYDMGLLTRGSISLGSNWEPGFPTWVYGYMLSDLGKRSAERLPSFRVTDVTP